MTHSDIFIQLVKSTNLWRDAQLNKLDEVGCSDLAFRPRNGMSSLGWLLAHQGVVYDFIINVLIKNGNSLNEKLLKLYLPGTVGDWDGTPLDEINKYYIACEGAFLEWIKDAPPSEFERNVDHEKAPQFFKGRTVLDLISIMITQLNYHTGHIESLRRDWESQKENGA